MDATDLVAQLCTLAGMIMEDESLTVLDQTADTDTRIATVNAAGVDIAILAAAAEVVRRRGR